MAVSFGYQYIVTDIPQISVIEGMFLPWSSDYRPGTLLQAVGIIGAVIMPHNLYLHSALVKSFFFLLSLVRSIETMLRK
ncbi:protein Malvolio-like [Anopheles merus]|uniref:protein Malvolio-like n=1 Tax=Anopheles merus TaxID=30066 RepID=UPI001BE474F4|nr:protein Malvolio-like [Anopheles merus]